MVDTPQLVEWFDSQVKRIDRLLEEKGYYLYHDMPELYESQLREQRYYYSMTILALTILINNDKHFPKIEAWEVVKECFEYFEMEEGDVFTHKVEGYFQTKQFDSKDLAIIKKALEIKNE